MRRSLSIVLALAALLGACKEDPVAPPSIIIPGSGEPIIYSQHIQPIFTRSCADAACHGSSSPQQGLMLTSWDRVMAGSRNGAMVVPFAALRSHLLQHIGTDSTIAPMASPRMPFGRDPLPREQILLIKRWIEEGAKNDDGSVALSGDRPRAFVTNQAEDLVSVIDILTQRVARYINVGRLPDRTSPPEAPHNIALSPDRRFFYVNLIAAGAVEKYDATTLTKISSVDVGLSPAQIAVTSDGSTLYVSNFDLTLQQRFISRVNTSSGQRTDIETGGLAPHGVTLSLDERFVYTSNSASDDISEIELATGEVTRIIPIVPGAALQPGTPARHEPYQSVLTRDGRLLYVTCRASSQVRVVDLTVGRVIDSIDVAQRPLILELTPSGHEIWVPNQRAESVSIIDVATRRVVATIPQLKTQPHAVAFSRDGRTAFITCENQNGVDSHHPIAGGKIPGLVYVVDVASRDILNVIEVGSFAAGIAISR